jgi:CubicO group peptidase (beta-lactamase class C family)
MTGLGGPGISRLHDLLAAHVDEGQMPGLIALVARGDDVHVEVLGTPSFTDPTPLAREAIFRIASLTKPITAVTALTLVEDGTLRLDDPIDDLVPELANRHVLRAIDAELDDTVPAHRAITVDDLLTFRMGFGTVLAPPDAYPIQRAETELGLRSIGGPPWPPGPLDVDGWIKALGTLPLMYQPGERWMYNTAAQVLGVVIARATRRDLGAVMRERVFDPLGMADTGFFVPADRIDRLTTFYAPDPETGALSLLDAPPDSWWSRPPILPDASGWLVSTIDDYWAFASMLASGGTRHGARILSADSVARMTADHVTSAQRAGSEVFLPPHASWGLGMEVPARGAEAEPLPCGYGWDGGTGTAWRTNAHHGVTGILLTQRAMTSPEPPRVYQDFWAGVNAAAGI